MRVIGGELRRRELRAPAGRATRPSSDRLRETLFNILGERVRGRLFVDAYAGTGAVGIEAWSRGARPVVWIEAAPEAARALRGNLAGLGILGGTVIERPALASLSGLERLPAVAAAGGCDFFFFDPPYADALEYGRVLAGLERRPRLVHAATTIIAEARRGAALPENCGRLRRARVHPQGDSQLVFYEVDKPILPSPSSPAAADAD